MSSHLSDWTWDYAAEPKIRGKNGKQSRPGHGQCSGTNRSLESRFSTVEVAIEAVACGRPVIVLDAEERENEGDIIAAAQKVTHQLVHFMLSHGRGLLCVPVLPAVARRLELTPMVSNGSNGTGTAFAVPVDHRSCKTGVSPAERALTIQSIVDPSSRSKDFARPGHVFPLIANEQGVLRRQGHTEAAIDLVRLAGLAPAAILCEICSSDGVHMARTEELLGIAQELRLPIITIEHLIAYRQRSETTNGAGSVPHTAERSKLSLGVNNGSNAPLRMETLEKEGRHEIDGVLQADLNPDLGRWVTAYQKVGRRDSYLWKWCRHAIAITTLSSVKREWRDEVCDTKVLGVMFDVLLDDVADYHGDVELLEVLLELPSSGAAADFAWLPPEQQRYAKFASRVWKEIQRRIQWYPCFAEYEELLQYDYQQLLNTMRYANLLNRRPELLNVTEHDLYLTHNMHMMASATLDLMCSPGFQRSELGRLREVVWKAQCMGRIGNLVTTWQRELREGDYTSGVFAHALTDGALTLDLLRSGDHSLIEGIIERGGHEAYFLNRWQEHRRWLLERRCELSSVNVGQLVAGLEKLIRWHLGSRGQK